MKILLIRPKAAFTDMFLGIPIGLVYLAAVAEKAGHEVEILDLMLEKSVPEAHAILRARLQQRKYDLFGLSCMTVEYIGALEAARLIREAAPSVPIVFGGQHPTIQPDEVISSDLCDFVVSGEGEDTFLELVNTLDKKGDPVNVAGILFHANGSVVRTPARATRVDVEALPWPAYHQLELDRYFEHQSPRHELRHKRALQIFTSRGCPWHCIYCHDLFGKKFRSRSPENVFGEMKMLYDRYGVREYMIEDDIFNFDKRRAKKICDLILASEMKGNIHLQFDCGLRLECFDEELVKKLAEVGTHHMAVAVESASPRIQKLIRKNLHLDCAADVLRWTRKYGITTMGYFMIGFPTETVEEIKRTIAFACDIDLDEALFSIVIPYAGTELSRMVSEEGVYDPNKAATHGDNIAAIQSKHFDFFTLRKIQKRAYLSFFLSKGRFWRLLPRLFKPSSSKKYLRAIQRNFFAYGGETTSRAN
jgi:anaerobic magnesium-protoporphyrin IX monomethyl ester cyclase